MRTNNKLNPHMVLSAGIEPGTDWWEASALTTTPSPFPSTIALFYLLVNATWPFLTSYFNPVLDST